MIFEAGPDAPDRINVTFDIINDNATLEAEEVFKVRLFLNSNVARLGVFGTTYVRVLDDDGMYSYRGH